MYHCVGQVDICFDLASEHMCSNVCAGMIDYQLMLKGFQVDLKKPVINMSENVKFLYKK